MKKEKQVKFYLFTGFLGSGKTTLLTKFLKELEGKKVGVIVNEFGKVGVDGEIIRRLGLEMVEISNGQIFCSCKEGDFIQTTVQLMNMDFDYILVEASGLALPGKLKTTLETIQMLCDKSIDYRGTVCVVGTQQFFDLIDVVLAYEEQIECSDIILINKIDLVEKKLLKNIEFTIRKLNQKARIMRTLYCDAVADILKESEGLKMEESKSFRLKEALKHPNEEHKPVSGSRIRKFFLVPLGILEKSSLEKFLEAISPFVYRMKGFIKVSQGLMHIDMTTGEIILVYKTNIKVNKNKHGLNIISNSDINIEEKIMEVWRENVTMPCLLS